MTGSSPAAHHPPIICKLSSSLSSILTAHAIGPEKYCANPSGNALRASLGIPFDTLEENAATKSATIFKLTANDCFSEDTGLFVDALDGEPGVKSARYAGDIADNKANIEKLLLNLADNTNRKARFRTIISLIKNGTVTEFEGICEGNILLQQTGENGFGYDAVFTPEGSEKSFAEMDIDEKNSYSHRKKAMAKLIAFLHQNNY